MKSKFLTKVPAYSNPDIDKSKLELDRVNLAPERGKQTDYIKEKIKEIMGERTLRKDAVKMCCWIVDAPATMPEEKKPAFFEEVYKFLVNRYGTKSGMDEDIVISAYIHKSETTDHLHFAFLPVLQRKNANGDLEKTFCAKEVIGREDLRTFHEDLAMHLESLGGNKGTGKELDKMNEFVVTSDSIDVVAIFVAVVSVIAILLAVLLQFTRLFCKKELVELKKAPLEKAFGIVFGKKGRKVIFSPAEADGHILTCAATGMGKTTTAITSLRQWGSIGEKDNGKIRRTMYCVDISGDIEKNCPRVHNKLVYAPLEKETVPYNLFNSIDMLKDTIAQNEALEQLAILLMPEKENMNDNARFFLINGRKILTSALIAFYHAGYDFPEICDILMSKSWEKVFAEIDRMNNTEASNLLNCFVGANDINTAGCFQQCTDAISLFGRSQAIKSSLRRPRTGEEAVEPNALETKNIFLKIPEDRLEMLKPLMRIISADIMNYITVRQVTEESPMILLFWDEFGSLKLDADTVVLPALRRARKRKCRIWVLCQNIADFTVLYGDAVTRSILSNFKYTLLLGGLGEPESQRYFADLIGYKKTINRSVTRSAQSVSQTESEQREYIIEPADLDKIRKEWCILIASQESKGYLKLKKKPYYKK